MFNQSESFANTKGFFNIKDWSSFFDIISVSDKFYIFDSFWLDPIISSIPSQQTPLLVTRKVKNNSITNKKSLQLLVEDINYT